MGAFESTPLPHSLSHQKYQGNFDYLLRADSTDLCINMSYLTIWDKSRVYDTEVAFCSFTTILLISDRLGAVDHYDESRTSRICELIFQNDQTDCGHR